MIYVGIISFLHECNFEEVEKYYKIFGKRILERYSPNVIFVSNYDLSLKVTINNLLVKKKSSCKLTKLEDCKDSIFTYSTLNLFESYRKMYNRCDYIFCITQGMLDASALINFENYLKFNNKPKDKSPKIIACSL